MPGQRENQSLREEPEQREELSWAEARTLLYEPCIAPRAEHKLRDLNAFDSPSEKLPLREVPGQREDLSLQEIS